MTFTPETLCGPVVKAYGTRRPSFLSRYLQHLAAGNRPVPVRTGPRRIAINGGWVTGRRRYRRNGHRMGNRTADTGNSPQTVAPRSMGDGSRRDENEYEDSKRQCVVSRGKRSSPAHTAVSVVRCPDIIIATLLWLRTLHAGGAKKRRETTSSRSPTGGICRMHAEISRPVRRAKGGRKCVPPGMGTETVCIGTATARDVPDPNPWHGDREGHPPSARRRHHSCGHPRHTPSGSGNRPGQRRAHARSNTS